MWCEQPSERMEGSRVCRFTQGGPKELDAGPCGHGLGFRLGARALLAALLALASAVMAQPAAAANDGSLERLKGKAGCLSVAGRQGCARARALDGPSGVAVSPGGGSVYVASRGSDAVAVFRRRGPRGALHQLRGRAGCRRQGGGRGCGRARALRDPLALVVSPDGRFVYVGSSQAIAVFGRNRRTGALRQLRGGAGCVGGRPGAGCGAGRALTVVSSLALGRDGRFLYVGSQAGIAVFRRNARTGRLVQLAGADGCVTAEARQGCARGRALSLVGEVALDGGGDNLYAASFGDNAVAVFDVDRGVPRQLPAAAGCISHGGEGGCTPARTLLGAFGLAASPNGAQLYATAMFNGAVAVLTRDRATGALSQPPGPLGCIRDLDGIDCADARHLEEPDQIELSHDGRNAYVAAEGGLVVLRRDRTTGELSQLPGKAGCIADNPPFTDCTDSRGLAAIAITLSPDGRNAYVTSDTDAIAVYRRVR
jgi:DNA-binding beta-propeller fold protein YncE